MIFVGKVWWAFSGMRSTAFRDIEAVVRTTEPQHPSTCLPCLTPAHHSYVAFFGVNELRALSFFFTRNKNGTLGVIKS